MSLARANAVWRALQDRCFLTIHGLSPEDGHMLDNGMTFNNMGQVFNVGQVFRHWVGGVHLVLCGLKSI